MFCTQLTVDIGCFFGLQTGSLVAETYFCNLDLNEKLKNEV